MIKGNAVVAALAGAGPLGMRGERGHHCAGLRLTLCVTGPPSKVYLMRAVLAKPVYCTQHYFI